MSGFLSRLPEAILPGYSDPQYLGPVSMVIPFAHKVLNSESIRAIARCEAPTSARLISLVAKAKSIRTWALITISVWSRNRAEKYGHINYPPAWHNWDKYVSTMGMIEVMGYP